MNIRSLALTLSLLASSPMLSVAAGDTANQDRPPAGGRGAPGAETLDEGTQIGAPGNIVTATEGAVLQTQDVNSDGFVDIGEAKTNGDLASQFARLDKNRDRRLGAEEFQAFTPRRSAVTGTAPTTPNDAQSPRGSGR